MFQKLINRLHPVISFIGRHLYGTVLACMVLWLTLFGEHSIYHLLSYKRQQRNLESQISAYRDSIANYERQINALTEGDNSLEQFAREQLLMKRDGEDIFIVDEE